MVTDKINISKNLDYSIEILENLIIDFENKECIEINKNIIKFNIKNEILVFNELNVNIIDFKIVVECNKETVIIFNVKNHYYLIKYSDNLDKIGIFNCNSKENAIELKNIFSYIK